jgi:hypothetical protein
MLFSGQALDSWALAPDGPKTTGYVILPLKAFLSLFALCGGV